MRPQVERDARGSRGLAPLGLDPGRNQPQGVLPAIPCRRDAERDPGLSASHRVRQQRTAKALKDREQLRAGRFLPGPEPVWQRARVPLPREGRRHAADDVSWQARPDAAQERLEGQAHPLQRFGHDHRHRLTPWKRASEAGLVKGRGEER